jgi:hypothetical protein
MRDTGSNGNIGFLGKGLQDILNTLVFQGNQGAATAKVRIVMP